jgi:hypothetical protein
MIIEGAATALLPVRHRVQIGADVTGNFSRAVGPTACAESEGNESSNRNLYAAQENGSTRYFVAQRAYLLMTNFWILFPVASAV